MTIHEIKEILTQFSIEDGQISFEVIPHGYINDTFLISINGTPKYVLQRLNDTVFSNLGGLQSNIDKATKKLNSPNYAHLKYLSTKDQATLLYKQGNAYRLMAYIPDSRTFNTTKDEQIAYESGLIIGRFHRLLEEEDLNDYHVTLPQFHDLSFRIEEFENAKSIATDASLEKTKGLIELAVNTFNIFMPLTRQSAKLRVCHNDTKLNNILFNSNSKALCLIDLDTIMPGYFHYDFGDAVRTIVNPSDEDEKDLSKIQFNLKLFERFVDGIIASKLKLSEKEIESLPLGVALMPFLHGLRMLTDYLNGNIYYKVSNPDQNLDRCRSLFHFTVLTLKNEDKLRAITNRLK